MRPKYLQTAVLVGFAGLLGGGATFSSRDSGLYFSQASAMEINPPGSNEPHSAERPAMRSVAPVRVPQNGDAAPQNGDAAPLALSGGGTYRIGPSDVIQIVVFK